MSDFNLMGIIGDNSIYNGFAVYTNTHLTVQRDFVVNKSFWERLFSIRPWIKTKIETRIVSDPEFYIMEKERKIIGHPETIESLKEAIKERNNG